MSSDEDLNRTEHPLISANGVGEPNIELSVMNLIGGIAAVVIAGFSIYRLAAGEFTQGMVKEPLKNSARSAFCRRSRSGASRKDSVAPVQSYSEAP